MDSVNFNYVSQQLDTIFANNTDSIDKLDCGDGVSLSRIPNRILSKYLHNKWKSDSSSDIYSNAYKFYTKTPLLLNECQHSFVACLKERKI